MKVWKNNDNLLSLLFLLILKIIRLNKMFFKLLPLLNDSHFLRMKDIDNHKQNTNNNLI